MTASTQNLHLMSPPDGKISDSFDITPKETADVATHAKLLRSPKAPASPPRKPSSEAVGGPPSPPESPWTVTQKRIRIDCDRELHPEQQSHSISDPVLYPDGTASTLENPLFGPQPEDGHVSPLAPAVTARPSNEGRKSTSRRKRLFSCMRQEHVDSAILVPAIGKRYNQNIGMYLKSVMDENHRLFRMKVSSMTIDESGALSGQQNIRLGGVVNRVRPDGGSNRKRYPARRAVAPKQTPNSTNVERVRPAKTRLTSSEKPEHIDFQDFPDYSPSTSNLTDARALKIDWSSSNPLDLTSDPHHHLLHPAELHLASTLRLSCAAYLKNKRLIFLKVHEVYAKGKEFRKTDAQQACVIDVNKASKLWVAFEKVGWFDKSSLGLL